MEGSAITELPQSVFSVPFAIFLIAQCLVYILPQFVPRACPLLFLMSEIKYKNNIHINMRGQTTAIIRINQEFKITPLAQTTK